MKAGIIGAGKVSTEHIESYRALDVEVAAVCSRTKERAELKIKECGIQAKAYDSLEKMLLREEIDLVSICSPPEYHPLYTIAAARAGKHLAIEKPIALDSDSLFAMHVAISEAGLKSVVGFVLRWNDLVQNIKRNHLVRLGKIFYMETDYWHGGSHERNIVRHEYGTRTHLACFAAEESARSRKSDIRCPK